MSEPDQRGGNGEPEAPLAALRETLRERYTPKPLPPCRVCGAALKISSSVKGQVHYHCSSPAADTLPLRWSDPAWKAAADHWSASAFIQTANKWGDPDVLRLLDAAKGGPPAAPARLRQDGPHRRLGGGDVTEARAHLVRRIAVARRQAQEVRRGIGYGGPDEKKRRALREAALGDRQVADLEAALGDYDRAAQGRGLG